MPAEHLRPFTADVNVATLAERFGLPLYVYDADKIIQKIGRMRQAFPDVHLKIKYAVKALTNVSILSLMRQQGVGVDVVSVWEARLAMHAGYAPGEIMFTPSGNSPAELSEAIDLGLQLNADSLPMLRWLGETYGNRVPVCLRINPNIVAGGNFKIQTGHADSKFGISIAQRSELIEVVRQYNLHVNGLHIHTGSDIADAATFLQVADVLFDLASDFPALRFLDFGGGFKVAYKDGDKETDMAALGAAVVPVFQRFCHQYGRNLELWFEPGKYLVSEAGTLLAAVNWVKPTPTRTFVHVDTGLNHLIRPMMYGAWHDIENLTNPDGPERLYDVVGYVCETDTFATDRPLLEVRPGDVLAIANAGAYGYSMASQYNSRPRPAEVLLLDGEAHLIRHRDTFEDVLRGQINIFSEKLKVKNEEWADAAHSLIAP